MQSKVSLAQNATSKLEDILDVDTSDIKTNDIKTTDVDTADLNTANLNTNSLNAVSKTSTDPKPQTTPEGVVTERFEASILPKHIAIIMDGNNRYAKAHGLAKGQGHVAGKQSLDPLVEHCLRVGIDVVTVFAFSSENWQRPPAEVALLMRLLKLTIHEQLPRMRKYNMRLRFIGDRRLLDDELKAAMADAEAQTEHFDAMTLVIAISYGGQWDITNAAKVLAQQVAAGTLQVDDINVAAMDKHMQLGDMPAVDMLIRTGGEFRVSNFLLWQSAYAELFFTPTLWPDFNNDELDTMLAEFAGRQRRFGKTSEQVDVS